MTPRARARAAVRDMAAGAAGPRLRSRWRRISAGRIAHICLRTVEFAAALFIVGGLILASVLARGPIRLVGLHDQIEASLRERVGDSYALTLGPTYIRHDSWGVGLGFEGLTLRDAAGRTVLSAPGGKVGLDPFALALLDVKVRRLELDGLDLRLRVAADGALSLAVANNSGATPIPLPGGAPEARGSARHRRFRPLRRRGHGRRRPGARPADPRQRLFRDPERCDTAPGRLQGFRRRVRPLGLDRARDDLGDRSRRALEHFRAGLRRRCSGAFGRSARFEPRRLPGVRQAASAADRRRADRDQDPGRGHAAVDAPDLHRPVQRRRRTRALQQSRRGPLFHRRGDRRRRLGRGRPALSHRQARSALRSDACEHARVARAASGRRQDLDRTSRGARRAIQSGARRRKPGRARVDRRRHALSGGGATLHRRRPHRPRTDSRPVAQGGVRSRRRWIVAQARSCRPAPARRSISSACGRNSSIPTCANGAPTTFTAAGCGER